MNRGQILRGALAALLVAAGLFATTTPASAVVYSGASDWKTISAGNSKSCGIRASGKLYCFNTNGTGSYLFSVSGYSDWKSVSVGATHQCAIRSTGLLYCWGYDTYGQLGNGSGGGASTPQRIGTASDWNSVSAGGRHTCAIRDGGKLYCWGSDASGQAGNGTLGSPTAPYPVSGTATDWRSVSAGGAHTCAIRGTGLLRCWGSDASGQAGNGELGSPTAPYPVDSTATNWRSVSAGSTHTCGILGSGLAACWGSDSRGQLGNGGYGNRQSPGKINSGVYDWKSVRADSLHTCGIRGSGALYCWGDNSYSQASSATNPAQSPDRYGSLNDWRSTDAGARHTCALRGTGSLYCWGAQTPPSNGLPAGTAYPSKILDLRRWKLTIPYDQAGDGNTVADEIKWAPFGTYISRSFFHANSSNSAVVFRSPVAGAKTGGSVFARSEMRERTLWNGTSHTNCNWSNKTGTHTLTLRQAVTHLPPRIPWVVVGQIHDPRDEVVMIRVNGSTIIAEASYPDPAYEDGRKVQRTLATGYKLGTFFTIKITANANGVYVSYNGGSPTLFADRVAKNTSPDKVTGDGWYFKAGLYLQTNTAKGEEPNEYGEGVISSVAITHPAGVCS